jgi:ABC-type Na+ efflux pump permease subunit
MPVAVHTISFRGVSGAIFIFFSLAFVLYVIGFATTGWQIIDGNKSSYSQGLWQECTCTRQSEDADWFKAVQAMITIGLIGLFICLLLACLYLCVHQVSKNSTIIGLVAVAFLTVIFMLIGFIIYGVKVENNIHWSFALCVIGCVFTLVGGILSFIQLRSSGVTL